MEFATSLSTGKTYEAFKVNYSQAKPLKLVCPVCKEKVFKRVRRIPHETHMFAHHKGGSPDCELYFPAASYGPSTTSGYSIQRGQTFEQFIRDIDEDLRSFLVATQIIPGGGIDERVMRLIKALVSKEVDKLVPSFKAVEESGNTFFDKTAQHPKAKELSLLIFEFYARDRARFIDALFCQWALYCISFKDDKADLSAVLNELVLRKKKFSDLAGIMLCCLSYFYTGRNFFEISKAFSIRLRDLVKANLIRYTAKKITRIEKKYKEFSQLPNKLTATKSSLDKYDNFFMESIDASNEFNSAVNRDLQIIPHTLPPHSISSPKFGSYPLGVSAPYDEILNGLKIASLNGSQLIAPTTSEEDAIKGSHQKNRKVIIEFRRKKLALGIRKK